MTIVLCSDSRFAMSTIESDSIGAIVTDPPYELNFMGRGWDRSGVAFDPETWDQALRILVPGGHLIAFGGTRTHHRMAVAIEDAGFEIRDSISWIYGSGFPKSLDISKFVDGWSGWGTALKPAHEPIILARKPLIGTVAANVTTHGAGGINVDACRVATDESLSGGAYAKHGSVRDDEWGKSNGFRRNKGLIFQQPDGRWPPNVVLTHSPECSADGCHLGGIFRVPSFSISGNSFHYSDNKNYIMMRFFELAELLSCCNTAGTCPSPNASLTSRIGSSTSGADADLAREVASVLGVSGLPDFQACCLLSLDWCGGHARSMIEAARQGPKQLRDVLVHVGPDLRSPGRIPHCQCPSLPSNWDGSAPRDVGPHIPENSIVPGCHPGSPDGTLSRTPDNRRRGRRPNVPNGNTPENNISASCGNSEIPDHTHCSDTASRLLICLAFQLASEMGLPRWILSRQEIDINLPSCPVAELDRQGGILKSGARDGKRSARRSFGPAGTFEENARDTGKSTPADSGGASRFFPTFAWDQSDWFTFHYFKKASKQERGPSNTHPTVKPIQLCRWLIRLVCPPGLPMLDPFAGSGSTLVAAKMEGVDAIGIEGDTQWLPVIEARVKAAERSDPTPAAVPRRRKARRDDGPCLPFGDD